MGDPEMYFELGMAGGPRISATITPEWSSGRISLARGNMCFTPCSTPDHERRFAALPKRSANSASRASLIYGTIEPRSSITQELDNNTLAS
jgi:hypothetical protein